MGIYDSKKRALPKFGFSWKQFKYPAIMVSGIVLIVIAFIALQWLFQVQPISASLNPNPLDLAQAQTAMLTVEVANTSQENAANAVLKISALAGEMFVITPAEQKIPMLESGGKRQFVFQIRPFNKSNPSAGVPAGDYKIKIVFSMNEQEFSKEIVLQIKRVA